MPKKEFEKNGKNGLFREKESVFMEKILLYQLLPRLFGNQYTSVKINGDLSENGCGKFEHISESYLSHLKNYGFTHVWFTGMIEHAKATDYSDYGIPADHPSVIKGKAGSPYAIKNYFQVDPDLATDVPNRLLEFKALIARSKKQGLKVVIDFVPNHVARGYYLDPGIPAEFQLGSSEYSEKAFSPNNNFYYLPGKHFVPPLPGNPPFEELPAKVSGNDCFQPNPSVDDWFETVKLNYGVDYLHGGETHFDPPPSTWNKMLYILQYWAEMGVDGFRCDMTEMVPPAFWEFAIGRLKEQFPAVVFIAEIYQTHRYQEYLNAGFDYLYDKSGLYDVLRQVMEGRRGAADISAVIHGENEQKLLRFLENHDEQRVASRFFCGNGEVGIPGFAVSLLAHRGPAMIYQGQETAEPANGASGFSSDDGRTSIFDYTNLPTYQRFVNQFRFDGGKLSVSEASLFSAYHQLLQLGKRKVFGEGHFYDLMYAQHSGEFNKDRLFAFLRHSEEEVVLLLASFHSEAEKGSLRIPQHAFELIGFNAGEVLYADRLAFQAEPAACSLQEASDRGIPFSLPPFGVGVWRLYQSPIKR